jgi:hypothetical protein
MNAPSIDIKDMLESDSFLGLVFETNLFIGHEPSNKFNIATIYDTGNNPENTLSLETYHRPEVQIRVKGTNYLTGWGMINKIAESLQIRAQEVWNGTLYSLIRVSFGPAFLNNDDKGNSRFIINIEIQRR